MICDKIQVAVRVRPPRKSDFNLTTKVDFKTIQVKEKLFSFDHVFDVYAKQNLIFEQSVKPLIENFLSGFNTTIFAYGQTGSGKTFTMGTDQSNIHFQDDDCGIIPRFLFEIFQLKTAECNFECTIQFLELYNEELRDLLTPRHQSSHIRLTDSKYGAILTGVSEKKIYSAFEALFYLNEGNKSRTTGSTAMNTESSRSHAIFTLNLIQKKINNIGCTEIIKSKFNFVDLAGSERLQRTKAIGVRAKEGININYSLLALGNVICALTENGTKSKRHIPYRDSKLTRLLEDSLGGHAKCMMIACVCPLMENYLETCNTLSYANRVNSIVNKISANHKVVTNNHNNCTNCREMQPKISKLEKEILELKNGIQTNSKLEKDLKIILENQKHTAANTLEDTATNFNSFLHLMSMEQDLRLLEYLPDIENAEEHQLNMEKLVLRQKIKSIKSFTLKDLSYPDESKTPVLDFIDKTACGAKTNSLDINNLFTSNSHGNLNLSQIHKLRWNYLLSVSCQQLLLKNYVQQEVIGLYEEQLAKFHQIFQMLISNSCPSPSLLIELMIKIRQPSQILKNQFCNASTPKVALSDLESTLNRLFPLDSDVDSLSRQVDIPMEEELNRIDTVESNIFHMEVDHVRTPVVLKRTGTVLQPINSIKRKRSIILKQEGTLCDQGFVKPNGLCLPVYKSPNKRDHLRCLNDPNSILSSLANQILLKRKAKPITSENIVANFRSRNLLAGRR